MKSRSSVPAVTSALVHHSAVACPATRARHAAFITKRLAIAFGALAVAPFFLAFRGAPTAAQAMVFAWCFAPLAAAVLVGRTGRIVAGHALAAAGLIGLGLTLWAALGVGAACAVACFAVAQLEAFLAGDRRLSAASAVASILCVGLIAVAGPRGSAALSQISGLDLVACIVLVYAMVATIDLADAPEAPPAADETSFWAAASALTDELVIGLDASGSVVHIPSNGRTLAGAPGAELVGRGLFHLVHIGDRPTFMKMIGDAAHGQAVLPARLRIRVTDTAAQEAGRAPQRHAWFEIKAQAVSRRDNGLAVAAALRDIDSTSALDAEIASAQSSLDEAIRSKDHFLANMSHELRTPLNAIIGFSEILASHTLRPADTGKQREYARIIHQSGQHLLSVVNSILDMSKIRSGTFAILPETFDVTPLLDLACDMIALKAEEGRIDLVRDYSDALEPMVGDKRACKQILINLLSNAVKFTPEGGRVTLSVRPEGNMLVIGVMDNGIGIGAADLARLGDPFFQARSALNRPFEGTGLGLSVVRGLVGLHGGSIELESELERGTHVTVRLPLDCRVTNTSGPSATIETLTPRRSPSPTALSDRRMKQIA